MEIKHKLTNEVLLTIVGGSLQYADLRWADLQGADLWEANLQRADLLGASLQGADLRGANLKYADLRGASLQGADLRGANLRGANILGADLTTDVIRIDGMRWDVMIFQDWMTIGCQHHHIDDWGKFTDVEISKMDYDALEFWQANKQKLFTIANLTK